MKTELMRGVEAVEAAREQITRPGLISQLFAGEPDFGLVVPFPEQSPEERAEGDQFCARVAEFLRTRVDPEAIERSGVIPTDVLEGLAEIGAFGMVIPRQYGGLGMSNTNYDRVLALVASHCNILALVLSVHQSIGVARPLLMFGTEEQRRTWLPRLAGGMVSAFALTEPEIGSDPANMATTAVLDGDEFVVNGEKLWCTNGTIARVIVLTAKLEGRVTAFLVEMDRPGIEILHRCEFMGCRGIENAWIRFTDVRIPRTNVLGDTGKGLRIALTLLNLGRVSVAAICLGMAKQMLGPTIAWANHRQAFGKAIGQHELNTQKLARMAADVYAMEAATWLVSGMVDRGGSDYRNEAAAAKLFCSERLWSVVDTALQIHGGRGYEKAWSRRSRGEADAAPVEQVFRDARLYLIGEGASEILRLYIAREALDPHIKRVTELLGANRGDQLRQAPRLVGHYARWYLERLMPGDGGGGLPPHIDGESRRQLEFVRRTSRRLARRTLELMARYNFSLERRQALVARLASISVELYVIAAVASYSLTRPQGKDLARQVFRDARRRIEDLFDATADNDDSATTAVGQRVLAGGHAWLSEGTVVGG